MPESCHCWSEHPQERLSSALKPCFPLLLQNNLRFLVHVTWCWAPGGYELVVFFLGRCLKFRFVSTLHQSPEFLKPQVFTLNCTMEIARWSGSSTGYLVFWTILAAPTVDGIHGCIWNRPAWSWAWAGVHSSLDWAWAGMVCTVLGWSGIMSIILGWTHMLCTLLGLSGMVCTILVWPGMVCPVLGLLVCIILG